MKNTKNKKKVVKAWAVIEGTGEFRKLFLDKSVAELNVSSYAHEKFVPCTITYTL